MKLRRCRGVMVVSWLPALLMGASFMWKSGTTMAQDDNNAGCSLCSDGSSVPFPDLVVLDNKGKKRTCETLQRRVANGVAADSDECRALQLDQGASGCQCPATSAGRFNPFCNVCDSLSSRSGTGVMVNPLEFTTPIATTPTTTGTCGDQVRKAATLQDQSPALVIDDTVSKATCTAIQSAVSENCPCSPTSTILCSPLCKVYKEDLATRAVTDQATCLDFKMAMDLALWATTETCLEFHTAASKTCCLEDNLPPALKDNQRDKEPEDEIFNEDCVDDLTKKAIYFGRRRNKFTRDCAWLATLQKKVVDWYCFNLVQAREGCLACTDTPVGGVDESRPLDVYEVRKRDCAWLQTRIKQTKKCNTSRQARKFCRQTCKTCDKKSVKNNED